MPTRPSLTERRAAADGGSFPCVVSAWTLHEAELRAYLRHRLGDPAAAADVLQDVFVKAIRHQAAFCSLESQRAWLFQVARNAMIDRARTSHPAEAIEDHADRLEAPAPQALDPVDALAACLATALERLPPDDAAILRACDIDGQSQREFAAAHALSLPAAKSRLLRARQRLRGELVQACGVRFDGDGRVCCHAAPSPGS
jgi:RNA polymerase sigma-70 factor (ECF subfamily)